MLAIVLLWVCKWLEIRYSGSTDESLNDKQKKNYEVNIVPFNMMIFQLYKRKLLRIQNNEQQSEPAKAKWNMEILQYHTVNISLCNMVKNGMCLEWFPFTWHSPLHTPHTPRTHLIGDFREVFFLVQCNVMLAQDSFHMRYT